MFSQSEPIVMIIGEKITNRDDFEAALNSVRNDIPNNGTCPGAAFQRALGQIMANDLLTRPKAGFLYTDGIFYDQPVPSQVSVGFHALGVQNYALGIAIPSKGNNQGLKPFEIKDQIKELEAFVGQNVPTPRIIQVDQSAFSVLGAIAQSFVSQFGPDAAENYPITLTAPYWCGFTTEEVSCFSLTQRSSSIGGLTNPSY